MTPLHPSIVHFPIVLMISAAGLYIAATISRKPLLDVVAFVFHCVGLISCIVAIFTGDFATSQLTPNSYLEAMIQQHEQLVTIATYGFGLLLIWAFLRQKTTFLAERIAFLLLFVGLNVLTGVGARIGGRMVYEKRAGVTLIECGESMPPIRNEESKAE